MSVLVCPECYGNGYITQFGSSCFFVQAGCFPDDRDVRCPQCGGEGRIAAEEAGIECNYGLEALALREWREANPDGLVGRLVDLHQRDPQRANLLAIYIERYYANASEPGEPWPYQWLMADVAAWPVVREPSRLRSCPSCDGSGRWGDDIPCGRCDGEGALR